MLHPESRIPTLAELRVLLEKDPTNKEWNKWYNFQLSKLLGELNGFPYPEKEGK